MEEAVQFTCGTHRLYGVLHLPDSVKHPSSVVIIITGGPQIRCGPHRLYIQLSRFLAKHGWASLRFDYEGLGDSEGDFVGFRNADDSISAAIAFLQKRINDQLDIFFWALCDGATAAIFYGAKNPYQIRGMVLCNPFTTSIQGMARSTIKHYYGKRFLKKEFLRKLISFELDIRATVKEFLMTLVDASFLAHFFLKSGKSNEKPLPNMVLQGLHVLQQPIYIFLSEKDMIASNFLDEWKKKKTYNDDFDAAGITLHNIIGADHTFTELDAKNELFRLTLQSLEKMACVSQSKIRELFL